MPHALRMAAAGLILAAAPFAAHAAPAPARNAPLGRQPASLGPRAKGSCTADGTYNEGGAALGDGTWTKTANKCKAPGTWTDSSGYTWALIKSGHHALSGTVTYHNIPGCSADVWPVSGSYHGKKFNVSATNPNPGDTCADYFGYKMTIE